jgi:hypothetical protein
MKLTPFGIVAIAENMLRDALSLPPKGGGKWKFQRRLNFNEQTGSLQIDILPDQGAKKTSAILQTRMTGSAREASIQGWIQMGEASDRETFVIKSTTPTRAEEEIFDIVDRVVSNIPEAEPSAFAPAPAPSSSFEPLLPEMQKGNSAAEEPFDPSQLFGSPETPSTAAPEEVPANSFFDPSQLFQSIENTPPTESTEPSPEAPVFDPSQLFQSIENNPESAESPSASEESSSDQADPAPVAEAEEGKPKASKTPKGSKKGSK